MVVIQTTSQLRFTLKIEVASSTARPIKTAPAPDAASCAETVVLANRATAVAPIARRSNEVFLIDEFSRIFLALEGEG